jgi:predicted porin
MKKSLVALATLSALGSAFADVDVSGGVKLYGILDAGVQSQTLSNPGTSSTSTAVTNSYQGIFASNATSRLGFKAFRDLSDGIKGVAQAEIQMEPDSATLLPSKNRQAFVGLSSESAGTILIGTMETTAYEVWGMDVNGRIEYKPQVWRTLTSVDLQDRANNSIKYITPTINGFTGHLMYGFSEHPSNNYTCTATVGANSVCSEFSSMALKYKGDNLTAAVVHDQTSYIYQAYKFAGIANAGVSAKSSSVSGGDVTTGTTTALLYGDTSTSGTSYNTPTQRDILAISYDFDGTLINYIYARSYQNDMAGSNTTNTIGIRKAFDKLTVAISYGTGTVTSANSSAGTAGTLADSGGTSDTTLGAYYNFDKSTSVYFLGSRTTASVGLTDSSTTTVAAGIRYNF